MEVKLDKTNRIVDFYSNGWVEGLHIDEAKLLAEEILKLCEPTIEFPELKE